MMKNDFNENYFENEYDSLIAIMEEKCTKKELIRNAYKIHMMYELAIALDSINDNGIYNDLLLEDVYYEWMQLDDDGIGENTSEFCYDYVKTHSKG